MSQTVVQVLLAIFALGILIAWHELGHYLLARLCGMRVERYAIGFGPRLFGFTKSDIAYDVNALPIGGFVQIKGMSELEDGAKEDPRSFINRPLWAKLIVIFAGPFFNYILAIVLFWGLLGAGLAGEPRLVVNQVNANSPAATAGLQSNDEIAMVNGEQVASSERFLEILQNSNGQPLHLDVRRGEPAQTLAVDVTPAKSESGAWRLGIGFMAVGFEGSSAFSAAVNQTWSQSIGILKQLGALVTGSVGGAQLGGVVEITRQLSSAAHQGLFAFGWLLASLSVVLGLFNLLPIPSLDGSKIVLLLIEGIIRRPIPAKAQMWIQVVGLTFVLGLMVILTIGDVMRIFQ